jgi:hypothetical protein
MTETCVKVVKRHFALAGGAAVYQSYPLQRRLRDIEVAARMRPYSNAITSGLATVAVPDERRTRSGVANHAVWREFFRGAFTPGRRPASPAPHRARAGEDCP